MTLSPVVLFVYNRPDHTKQTVEALQKNELAKESELFIYSDEAKNEGTRKSVDEVREYIDKIDGFKKVTIIKREKNWGLADSIIDGVTKIVNEYGKIIVLEDDLVTSPYFLKFMNISLNYYDSHEDIYTITGYNYPLKINDDYKFGTYLYPRGSSKSWATWKNRWNNIEFNEKKIINKWNKDVIKEKMESYGKDLYSMFLKQIDKEIDSWAIRFAINQIMQDKYSVYPIQSYVKDIGDDIGTHANKSLPHKNILANKLNDNFTNEYNIEIADTYMKYLKSYFMYAKINSVKNRLIGLFR